MGDQIFQPWEEAVERDVEATGLALGELTCCPHRLEFDFPEWQGTELLRDPTGEAVGAFLRRQQPIEGMLEVAAERIEPSLLGFGAPLLPPLPLGEGWGEGTATTIPPDLSKITARVLNLTPCSASTRDDAMHELALAEGILAVALDAAEEQPVQRISLRVGTLQRVVPDSLQFSFQLLAEHTPAAGALLEIKHIPARVRCTRCGARGRLEISLFRCRSCGASEIQIMSGEELLVDAVELERGWRYRPRRVAPAVSRNHLIDHAVADAVQAGTRDPRWEPVW